MSVRLDRLAAARRRGFVGRQNELRRFEAVLKGSDDSRVVYVHGPGGPRQNGAAAPVRLAR